MSNLHRRTVLALACVAGIGGFSGCSSERGDEISAPDNESEQDDTAADMAGAYDFSSCEYDLDDETISYSPLDETVYNNPKESDTISVAVGYDEQIEADELQEIHDIFGDNTTHSEDARSISTGRDGIDKCAVAKLSNKDYIEYIIPLPVEEE